MSNLETLEIRVECSKISGWSLEPLNKCKNLRRLCLESSYPDGPWKEAEFKRKIIKEIFESIVENLPNLEDITLRGIFGVKLNAIKTLTKLKKLRRFDLQSPCITDKIVLHFIWNCDQLRSIHLFPYYGSDGPDDDTIKFVTNKVTIKSINAFIKKAILRPSENFYFFLMSNKQNHLKRIYFPINLRFNYKEIL